LRPGAWNAVPLEKTRRSAPMIPVSSINFSDVMG
jgi:hypothetical protein